MEFDFLDMNFSNRKFVNQLNDEIEKIYPQMLDIRRHIHRNPELSQEESRTAAFIIKTLSEMGIESSSIAENGVMGTIYGNHPDKTDMTVAIRADIDALPIHEETGLPYASSSCGKMHACGHDIHTAILLGAAMVLSNMKDSLKGNIRLLFQPAEETVGGAEKMIEEGCLNNPHVCAVLGMHVNPFIPCGSIQMIKGVMNAASAEVNLEIYGKTCHGAHPETGVDSILAASTVICALQSIISRNIAPTDSGIVTIGTINGGSQRNIIAGKTVCTGIIRALTLSEIDFLKDKVSSMAHSVAEGMGCQCSVYLEDCNPPLENDAHVYDIINAVGKNVLGDTRVIESSVPSLGTDDFAYFCQKVPSLYFNLGVAHDDQKMNFPLHSEKFNPKEDSMKTGILMEVLGCMAILDDLKKTE